MTPHFIQKKKNNNNHTHTQKKLAGLLCPLESLLRLSLYSSIPDPQVNLCIFPMAFTETPSPCIYSLSPFVVMVLLSFFPSRAQVQEHGFLPVLNASKHVEQSLVYSRH